MKRLSVTGLALLLAACGSAIPEPARSVPIAVTIYATMPAPATATAPAAAPAVESATSTPASIAPTPTSTSLPLPLPPPTPTPTQTPESPGEPKATSIKAAPQAGDVEGARAQLLELLNQDRASNGLLALAASPILQQSAQIHAQDLSQSGKGSHTGSDGSTFQDRIKRAGYPGSVLNLNEGWAWQASPQGAHDWWMNDPHHRPILLSQSYTEVGFGIAPNPNGGFFFVANLGSPSP